MFVSLKHRNFEVLFPRGAKYQLINQSIVRVKFITWKFWIILNHEQRHESLAEREMSWDVREEKVKGVDSQLGDITSWHQISPDVGDSPISNILASYKRGCINVDLQSLGFLPSKRKQHEVAGMFTHNLSTFFPFTYWRMVKSMDISAKPFLWCLSMVNISYWCYGYLSFYHTSIPYWYLLWICYA